MTKIVKCPHCKKDVIWNSESEFRPFCSERCRLQDLGAWFTEEHAIKGPSQDESGENQGLWDDPDELSNKLN